MYNTIPEILRKMAIENVFSTKTYQNCWKIWQPEILKILGNNYSENEILNLGDHLSEIFRKTGGGGRGQGELSASGTAWESLVCWYINLCAIGSRVVAIKKMSIVPKSIQDAITVNYGNFACNTESDITIIVFPDLPEYNSDVNHINVQNNQGNIISPFIKTKFNSDLTNFLAERDFNNYEIGIIQCKTNWNDNAQIPMLWDMIYSSGGFRGRNITIGRNGFNIQNIQSFSYSFVTVPSNVNTEYKPNAVSVKRVTNLSGGNYWGNPSLQNVAKSLKEIFTNNFQSGSKTGFRTDLRNALPELEKGKLLTYFGLH
jgi:hypothetical protein